MPMHGLPTGQGAPIYCSSGVGSSRLWMMYCVGILSLSVLVCTSGCATTAQAHSTRLTDADLQQAVLQLRDQLAASRWLLERDTSSPPDRLVVRKVENLSSDRIPMAEQWSLVLKLISHRGVQDLLKRKHIIVQLPPEKVEMLEAHGFSFPQLTTENQPTMVMRAQIASASRLGARDGQAQADIRRDYYLLSMTIEDLTTRAVLWQGQTELSREARGSLDD